MSYCLRAGSARNWFGSAAGGVRKPAWQTPLLCVQWKTPDDGHRKCPKHVEFYSKNKFEKLVHLVGFIIRIYHDARSPENQIWHEISDLLIVSFSNKKPIRLIRLLSKAIFTLNNKYIISHRPQSTRNWRSPKWSRNRRVHYLIHNILPWTPTFTWRTVSINSRPIS